MSHRRDKAAKRKAKLKARKAHAEHCRHRLNIRIAEAIMDLCADVLPEYVDDSKGPDLVGRDTLWRLGMVAWNIAVTGRKEIDDAAIAGMKLDAEAKEMVRNEVNRLVRLKYGRYPELRTAVSDISAVIVAGKATLKVTLGSTFPEMPIPDFDDAPKQLTPDQILAKRKELGLSQVKFAAALGVSVKKLSAWEHGKAAPSEAEMGKIIELPVERTM